MLNCFKMQVFAGLKSPETLMALVDPESSNLSGSTIKAEMKFRLRRDFVVFGGLKVYFHNRIK